MKKWITPTIEELDLKETATVGIEDETSGMPSQEDYGRCSNLYWKGTESTAPNPYYEKGWQGGWGN